jgi:hypothetical protein
MSLSASAAETLAGASAVDPAREAGPEAAGAGAVRLGSTVAGAPPSARMISSGGGRSEYFDRIRLSSGG